MIERNKFKDPDELCRCIDCDGDEDVACHSDCEPGEECFGCVELRKDLEDQEFEFKKGQGIV